jgi:hypothetical protein
MKVIDVLSSIDAGAIALPEFQRGYVWNRDQVRGLMHSLYRRYPVGSLLVWLTRPESEQTRGGGSLSPGAIRLLLDGQQRITTLYGIIRGKPPQFFEGNEQAFTNLYFHLDDEVFEFYGPLKMRDNPLWINVTELMQNGVGLFITRLMQSGNLDPSKINTYINRLTAIENIRQIDFHVEEVAGEDKTIDIVVDIFNRVNSGGTTLSKGDLALAKIGANWPQARGAMNGLLEKWQGRGFSFKLEWLLRCINAVTTGNALYSALAEVKTPAFQKGLAETEELVDSLLDMVVSRLGLDHDHVLGSRYSFPLLARYLSLRGGRLEDRAERDRLLFWYIHTFLWGRYAGSTESALNQDLAIIQSSDAMLEGLIQQLRQNRGDLRLAPDDFTGWGTNNRFYPFLYMLTRVGHARDWASGRDMTRDGARPHLQLHNIFPKDLLYDHRYSRPEVNAIANYAFVTPAGLSLVGKRHPADYLEELEQRYPGTLASYWIPLDRQLWHPERYRDFLIARRELLAQAANTFLEGLRAGVLPELDGVRLSEAQLQPRDEETLMLQMCNAWMRQQGLPQGEMHFEVKDPTSDEPFTLDLAWPDGLRPGSGEKPTALLLSEEAEVIEAAQRLGYQAFTSVPAFYRYVERDILTLNEESSQSVLS